MKLSSKEFGEHGVLPKEYTCDGKNINPPLVIEGVPKEAKALALTIDDISMPTGRVSHWVVWNINPKTISISKGSRPFGSIMGTNGFGKATYSGPCPPENEEPHQYRMQLYALREKLELSASDGVPEFEDAVENLVVDTAETVATYQREQQPPY